MIEGVGAVVPALPLTTEHLQAIVAAMRAWQGREPSKAEVARVVDWIENVCINAGLVQGILGGHMAATFPKGGELSVGLTNEGVAYVEDMLER